MTSDRNNILNICRKLKKQDLIIKIEEEDYCIKIMINEDLWTNTAYEVRDRIKMKFERLGYVVKIGGTWWLRITYFDALGIVDDCFDDGDVE